MGDKITKWIVWRLPRSWIKWAGYRILEYATTGKYSKPVGYRRRGITAKTALKRWKE